MRDKRVVKKLFCLILSLAIVRGKVILQPQGKEFFTCRGKNFFTSCGKEFFT